jgi:preprotein translocase subunit SecB
MSDTSNNTSEVKFKFLNFIVKESHIILNEQGEYTIAVNFIPKGYIFTALNQFHLELDVEVKDENNKFHINIKSVAIFEFEEGANIEEYKSGFFILNAPAIAFPYIRAYISNLTTQSGLFTVTLPTFNLTGLGKTLGENLQEVE